MPADTPQGTYRWFLVAAAFVTMALISIYQYSWFLFGYALREQYGWGLDTIGLTFTVFAYSATFVQPFSGFVADTLGPNRVSVLAAALVSLGLLCASWATTPLTLHLFYGLGGVGVGVLYGVCTACAIKWFPDRRGFATGLVVFGFGAGTAVFNPTIESLLDTHGIATTFRWLALVMAVVLVPLSFIYRYPGTGVSATADKPETPDVQATAFRPRQMLKTYQWYLIYFSFAFTVSIVLLFGAQMKILAKEFGIPKSTFSLVLVLFPLGNGLSRIISGAISDRIGRGNTMMLFYSLLAGSIVCFLSLAHIPALFVMTVFLAGLLGGAPFALYPATIGDFYGDSFATTNYGITYTAKAWAGLISGWLSGYLVIKFGSYQIPLILLACGCLAAAAFSHPKLMKPPRQRSFAR